MNWLFLRGLTREARHWGAFPDLFAARLPAGRVVCLDLPGAGTERGRRSPASVREIAEDVRRRWQALPQLGEDAWAVLGISLGGMVALEWCARHPDDFARAVLINTSAGGVSRAARRLRPRPRNLGALWKVARAHGARDREAAVLAMTSARAADRAGVLDEWVRIAAEAPMSTGARLRQLVAALRFEAPPALPTPALLLSSRGDGLVHHSCSERLARRYGAPVALHPDAGHDLTLDDPAWVTAQVVAWASTAVPRPSAARER